VLRKAQTSYSAYNIEATAVSSYIHIYPSAGISFKPFTKVSVQYETSIKFS
jgi:hypothetical protein